MRRRRQPREVRPAPRLRGRGAPAGTGPARRGLQRVRRAPRPAAAAALASDLVRPRHAVPSPDARRRSASRPRGGGAHDRPRADVRRRPARREPRRVAPPTGSTRCSPSRRTPARRLRGAAVLPRARRRCPTAGRHLAYLDVWQREVTTLEDPDLVEIAVGVDTTARSQTAWQVRVLPEHRQRDLRLRRRRHPGLARR